MRPVANTKGTRCEICQARLPVRTGRGRSGPADCAGAALAELNRQLVDWNLRSRYAPAPDPWLELATRMTDTAAPAWCRSGAR
jgi:hypothetical protein